MSFRYTSRNVFFTLDRSPGFASHHACLALMIVGLCLLGSLATAEQIINQSFAVDSTPTGWVVQGTTAGSPSTALTASHFYGAAGTQDYLQLTSNPLNQRASAYYTAHTFNASNFTLTASLYMAGATNPGDGLTFSFLDATTIGTYQTQLLGAYGDYMGAPRRGTGFGQIPGLSGYNFEFDSHINAGEVSGEYTSLLNVSTGSEVSGSQRNYASDPNFFYGNGWEQVQLRAYDGRMYFYWNYNGSGYGNSYDFAQPSDFSYGQTIFGVTAATATLSSDQWVRGITLESNGNDAGVPEPSSLALLPMALTGLMLWRRRRKA